MNTVIISILTGLGGMLGWGACDFIAAIFSKKIGPLKTFFWSQLAGLVFAAPLILAVAVTFNFSALAICLLPTAALVYMAAYLFLFKGFEVGNISIVAATANLWAPFTMFFAFVFMGQRLSSIQFTGILIVIFGATLVSLRWEDIQNHGFQFSSGVKEAILCALFFGLFWNLSEVICEEIGWVLATFLIKAEIILILLVFFLLKNQNPNPTETTCKITLMIVIMGFLEVSATAIVNYGLTIGDAILITPISSALSIVTISMAIIFLKERVTRTQIFGIISAITGIIITAF